MTKPFAYDISVMPRYIAIVAKERLIEQGVNIYSITESSAIISKLVLHRVNKTG